MVMQFSINKDYANRYNEFRRKEELQKLRERYGDVKIGKRIRTAKEDELSEKAEESEDISDNSSCDSSSSDYSDSSDVDHEDFLVLYDALCRNDASLNDPNKHWFREKTLQSASPNQEHTKMEPGIATDSDSNVVKKNSKKRKSSSLNLRDYERKFLLEDAGLENEAVAADAATISKMESDQFLHKLADSAAVTAKQMFLSESTNALEQAGVTVSEESHGLDFLQRRTADTTNESGTKATIDFETLRFTDASNPEAEEFLRDYIINQRWKRPKEAVPSYEDVLRQSNVNVDPDSPSTLNQLFDGNISEDDEFLLKAREFERTNQTGNSVFSCGFDGPPIPKHRFQEEDKEFVKSYPRKIESSLQNPTADGKSSRSQKREARKARKAKEKQARMEELERLRRMKLAMFADKIDRIRRSCGVGCSIPDLIACDQSTAPKNASDRRALELAMYLDEDWDPDKHNKLLENMFGDSYYSITENEHKIPRFSDISDVDSDVESKRNDTQTIISGVSEGTSRASLESHDRKAAEVPNLSSRHRNIHLKQSHALDDSLTDSTVNPDYEAYFDERTKLTCDDIIPGQTPDDHVYCRFPYRQVSANDFGLSTEEILTATPRELNSWVSIRRVAGYLTEQEEERNRRLYHSGKKLQKKSKVIISLSDPNAHWWPETDKDQAASTASGKTKRRSRKKRKRKGMSVDELIDNISASKNTGQTKNEAPNPSPKRLPTGTKKIKGINVPLARLTASGLTAKDIYRVQSKSRHTESSNTELSK